MDEEVYLVSEIWIRPGCLEEFRHYLARMTGLMHQHGAEFVYHGHPYESVSNPAGDALPTGVQVVKFESEAEAHTFLSLLDEPELKAERGRALDKSRTYLSKLSLRPEVLVSLRSSRPPPQTAET